MNPKYQKVCADIAKLESKSADIEKQLGELREKKTELENLEIINTVALWSWTRNRSWLSSPT